MSTTSKKEPMVSIIMVVLNGEKYIRRSLTALVNQSYKNKEIIVVDNFSTDNTQKIVKSFKTVKLYLKGPERTSQLKYGVKMSKGKYFYYTGCDLVADKDYVTKCVNLCERTDTVAVYAHVLAETTNFWSKVKGLERECYINDPMHEAARFIRRDVFDKIGGFDDKLTLHSDDYELQARLNKFGYKTGSVDAYEYHVDEIDSLKEVFLKSFYYGMNSLMYIKKHKTHAVTQLMPVRSAFFKNYKLLLSKPHLTLGLLVFKVVQYSSASAGLLMGILKMNKVSKSFHAKIYKSNRD